MVMIPAFLLRRLYVKSSLKNVSDGFEFQLRNRLGSGYAHKMWPLSLDGEEVPIENTFFVLDGRKQTFSDVSKDSTFTLAMNKTITISVDHVSVDPGPHKIGMGFDVPGLGTLRFDFTDVVSDS